MKNDKLVPGMILVMIGAIFLLHNFGYIHFHWSNIWHLWPVFLVIGGINLVFANNRSPWATILKITVIVGGFALIIFGNFEGRYKFWPHMNYHYSSDNNDNDDNDDDDSTSNTGKTVLHGTGNFKEPYNSSVKVARLNISGGATTYRLNDSTDQLFAADTKAFRGRYELSSRMEDSVYVMNFDMKENKGVWNWGSDDDSNTADLMLNTRPVWEINVETGATDLNFDLSKYKVRSLKLSGGASQFVVKLGQPLQNTNVNISTGAADVTIDIPQNAACTVTTESGLSSNTFDGFIKKDDGHSETENFEAATNKMYIHISGGISDFKIHRY